ncbi:MAG: sulfotransferase domain-containing protein [Candidatus Paceibacterota bacterium]
MNKRTEIQLVASHFPSGLSWLNNFLLEIGVLAYNGDATFDGMWQRIGDHTFRLKETEERQRQWLPVLSKKLIFDFPEDIMVRWSHNLPMIVREEQKTILFVRDGRDAVYSAFKREGLYSSLEAMVKARCAPLSLTPPETWAVFNRLWIENVTPSCLRVVKFEDLKTKPYETIKDILEFIGVERRDADILSAIESSSFENAKRAEVAHKEHDRSTIVPTINRSGAIFEWKGRYDSASLSTFKGFPEKMLSYLGYETSGSDNKTRPDAKLPGYTSDEEKKFVEAWQRYTRTYRQGRWQYDILIKMREVRAWSKNVALKLLSIELLSSLIKTKDPYIKFTYSPNGEDILIGNILMKKNSKTFDDINGLYVSIDPPHPRKCSYTYLLYNHGWRGLNIVDASLYSTFRRDRPHDKNFLSNNGEGSENGRQPIKDLLSKNLPRERSLGLLVLDQESRNGEMVESNIWSLRPKLVIARDSRYSPARPDDSELYSFMKRTGYSLIGWMNQTMAFLDQTR